MFDISQLTNMIGAPANPLLLQISPYNYYEPVQILLNELRREMPSRLWQKEFYITQIQQVIRVHLGYELDWFDPANVSSDSCDELIKIINKKPSHTNDELTRMISNNNINTLLTKIGLNNTSYKKKLLKALIKIEAAYCAISYVEHETCELQIDEKNRYTRIFKRIICEQCDKAMPAWRNHTQEAIAARERAQKEEEERRQAIKERFDQERQLRQQERTRQRERAVIRRYNARWDRAFASLWRRYLAVFLRSHRLLKWDNSIKHFMRNLIWSSMILSKFISLSAALVLYWVPFKALMLPLTVIRALDWVCKNRANRIEESISRVYGRGAIVGSALVGVLLMLGYGLFFATGKLLPFMGVAPYIALPVFAGVIGASLLVGGYFILFLSDRIIKSVSTSFRLTNNEWENNIQEKNEIKCLNRLDLQHALNYENVNIENLDRFLSAPVHVPLDKQVTLTSAEVANICKEVIRERVSDNAFSNLLQVKFEEQRTNVYALWCFYGLPTFEQYKEYRINNISRHVEIDEGLVSEPRLR